MAQNHRLFRPIFGFLLTSGLLTGTGCSSPPPLSVTEFAEQFRQQKITAIEKRKNDDWVAENENQSAPISPGDFKTGDILLVRLKSDTNYRQPFPHLIFIAQDAAALKTIEIYPGGNLSVSPIPSAKSDPWARVLHLRMRDQNLAQKSASQFLAFAESKTQEPIAYDDEGNLRDHKKLTSLEILQVALEMGSEGKFRITDRLDELELDPRFETLKEWRDLASIRRMRALEAIQNQMAVWENDLGYRAYGAVKSPTTEEILVDALNKNPKPLTYAEMIQALEALRIQDMATYDDRKTRSQSLFHRQYRADPQILRQKERQKAAPKDPRAGTQYPALEN